MFRRHHKAVNSSFDRMSSRILSTRCSRSREELKSESIMGPNWLDLPIDVTAFILQKLSVADILTSARQVCSLWWNICKDPLMMRSIDQTLCRNYPAYMLRAFCRYAVDQSCGHLEDITIEYFATDDFLKYIASRYGFISICFLAYFATDDLLKYIANRC